MLKADVLTTRKFRESFYRHVSMGPTRIRIAVPFVGDVPGYGTLADFVRVVLRDERASMELITRPPETGESTIKAAMAAAVVALGVELVFRPSPPLHAKVYQVTFPNGSRAAYVGSANLTAGGLKRNDEAMALLLSEEENKKVEVELDRLAGRGAVPYGHWRVKEAYAEGRRRRSGGK